MSDALDGIVREDVVSFSFSYSSLWFLSFLFWVSGLSLAYFFLGFFPFRPRRGESVSEVEDLKKHNYSDFYFFLGGIEPIWKNPHKIPIFSVPSFSPSFLTSSLPPY